jgi:hypothetical protein
VKKILLIVLQAIVPLINLSAQNKIDYIVFEKPYTDSLETNLYKAGPIKFDFKTQYYNVKKANITEDLNRAISHNDFRFISISGVGYLFPGLENKKYNKYLKKYKFKVVLGTSDAHNMSEPPLQGVAYDYGEKYNKLLLTRIYGLEHKRGETKPPKSY